MHHEDRDWHTYNEQLVMRGEILLKVDVLKDWQKEVAKMNAGKQGRPFLYPHIMMLLYGMMRAAFGLPYRQLEGFARGLGKLLDMPAPDYSTFSIRIPQLKLDPYPRVDTSKPVTLAIDSSGLKLTQGGQWHLLPIACIKRKEWVKIHVAVDVDTKQVISVKFGPGQFHDAHYLWELLRDAEQNVKIDRVLADTGYDSERNHNLLRRRGIKRGIKPRSNSTSTRLSKPRRTVRASTVRQWERDPDQWKQDVGYGQRQIVEGFFSSFKRQFGEHIQNRTWLHILEELRLKVWLYNLWVSLSPDQVIA